MLSQEQMSKVLNSIVEMEKREHEAVAQKESFEKLKNKVAKTTFEPLCQRLNEEKIKQLESESHKEKANAINSELKETISLRDELMKAKLHLKNVNGIDFIKNSIDELLEEVVVKINEQKKEIDNCFVTLRLKNEINIAIDKLGKKVCSDIIKRIIEENE